MGRAREIARLRRRVRIGAPDPGLTRFGGMVAATELVDRLGMIKLLDGAIGPIKTRQRGYSGGELLIGIAAAQLAGEDFLVGLDRQRADAAGQLLAPVARLSSTTAAGLARRFTPAHFRGVEGGVAAVTAAMPAMLAATRAAALCQAPTIDLDTTDGEVYGRQKRGVACNHHGQRVGRPHVATWAETGVAPAADLMGGNDDPRSHPAGLFEGVEFAIGAKRIAPLWRSLSGIAETDWVDAVDTHAAQVAVTDYCPDWWPARTRLLIRRVRLDIDAGQVWGDPRSRRRRTLHPDQRALPPPELADADAVYAYSFIMTNLDVSTPERAATVEHWYRHRTEIENIFRDSKHGSALRHLPSGYPQLNTVWMWGALLATSIAGWLHQLTATTHDGRLVGPFPIL